MPFLENFLEAFTTQGIEKHPDKVSAIKASKLNRLMLTYVKPPTKSKINLTIKEEPTKTAGSTPDTIESPIPIGPYSAPKNPLINPAKREITISFFIPRSRVILLEYCASFLFFAAEKMATPTATSKNAYDYLHYGFSNLN